MHFYEKTAAGVEPRHFVNMSSRPGETRPTRLTDARKNAWYPSVTTVAGLLDKPALTDWKILEHLKHAYKVAYQACTAHEDAGPESLEEWVQRVKGATQDALDKAPKDGTDFHDVLEKWFSAEKVEDPNAADMCLMVENCLDTNTSILPQWIPEKSFVHPMGFAGKTDLHCKEWVIDFKTKNTKDKWKPGKMAYPEMAMQLAAYRVGLGLDSARCANVFICLETSEVEFYEWGPEELDRQWANFSDILRVWLRNAGYTPGK